MPKCVLVVGAGGFIGRHIAQTLSQAGISVIAATRRPCSFNHPGIRNAVDRFDDPTHFTSLLEGCSSVLYAASSSTPGSSEAKPQLDGNLRPTLALLEALQRFPDRRLVYLSSGGTLYGECELASESELLRPRSYHGAGKAAAEHFIHAWAMQYGGTSVVLRPSNVYGPGQMPRAGFGIVPTAFQCLLRNEALTIWGGTDTVRDYLYIDDMVAICRLALTRSLSPGVHVYNASAATGVSLTALLNRIQATSGRHLQINRSAPRRVDVRVIVLDNARAAAELRWQPQVSLDEGLRLTWDWCRTAQTRTEDN